MLNASFIWSGVRPNWPIDQGDDSHSRPVPAMVSVWNYLGLKFTYRKLIQRFLSLFHGIFGGKMGCIVELFSRRAVRFNKAHFYHNSLVTFFFLTNTGWWFHLQRAAMPLLMCTRILKEPIKSGSPPLGYDLNHLNPISKVHLQASWNMGKTFLTNNKEG